MPENQISISEAIDLAVAKMRPIRRAVMQRRLRNADYREGVASELLLKLWADSECCTLIPGLRAAKADDAFASTTSFAIDPANLEKFLEIIMKYLPQILELLLKFLPLLIALALACLLALPANAGYPAVSSVEAGGGSTGAVKGFGSSGSKASYASSGSVAVQSYGSTGSAVAKSYGSTGSVAVQSYGSTGSAAVQSYGSSGSSIRDRRPLLSILENKPVRTQARAVVGAAAITAGAMRDGVSSAYQIALASATQRAATRRKGHLMSVEAGHTVGVGWSSFDPQPNTCFGRGGYGYAVVRGVDGWYATKVVQ